MIGLNFYFIDHLNISNLKIKHKTPIITRKIVINCKIEYNKIAIYLFFLVELIKFAHKI
jgi:hypothetical protein